MIFQGHVEPYSPPTKYIPRRLSETSFADEGMGAENDQIGEMDSLATGHGTKPFQELIKLKSGKMRKKRKKGL